VYQSDLPEHLRIAMGARAVDQQMRLATVPLIEAVYLELAAACKPLLSGPVYSVTLESSPSAT